MRLAALTAMIVAAIAVPLGAAADRFPERIDLPPGFQPEGIAIAPGGTFYVGSIPTGAIYSGDLRTGEGALLVPAQQGRSAIGLDVDNRGRLFVAGGGTGQGYVYDAKTGAPLATYQLSSAPTFVNDVVVTRQGAWFTESNASKQFLYLVPIAPNGALGAAQTVPLTGDIVYQPGFNVNGIDATPNGKTLVIVQSNTGKLFTVDAASGVTREIDLGGESVPQGDGILLDGRTLYVVQNRLNVVAVIELAPDMSSGTVVARLSHEDFSVPTTIDEFGNRLYLVNARFGTPATPSTPYWVTQMRKPRGS